MNSFANQFVPDLSSRSDFQGNLLLKRHKGHKVVKDSHCEEAVRPFVTE